MALGSLGTYNNIPPNPTQSKDNRMKKNIIDKLNDSPYNSMVYVGKNYTIAQLILDLQDL